MEEEKEQNVLQPKGKEIPFAEKFKGVFKKENFVLFALTGILLLVISFPTGKEKEEAEDESLNTDSLSGRMFLEEGAELAETHYDTAGGWQEYVAYLENALEELLGTMEGAGKVKVMITLSDTGQQIVEKDVTETLKGDTRVSAGESDHITDRSSEEKTVLESREKGLSSPYVKQVISPQIKGVAVSVQGGGNPEIHKNISETIQALFGIDVHKIKIIKMSTQS
ncbi:MAG: hypothetical protein IKY23_11485 [Lachnospiraceae bacterium]|nr:hypothetical protein [Lachnospiraceae bacterium]